MACWAYDELVSSLDFAIFRDMEPVWKSCYAAWEGQCWFQILVFSCPDTQILTTCLYRLQKFRLQYSTFNYSRRFATATARTASLGSRS